MSQYQVDIVVKDTGATVAGQHIKDLGDHSEHAGEQVEHFGHKLEGLHGILAGLGLGLELKEIIELADEFVVLQNKLITVQTAGEDLDVTLHKLEGTALKTHQQISTTVDIYTAMAKATVNLRLSQDDLMGVITTINQALHISGKAGDEVSGAMKRFALALQQGQLEGRGLTTILIQFPQLAKAIADGMGKDIGELHALSEQGALTASQVVTALQKSADKVDALSKQMKLTVVQAWQDIKTELLLVVGRIDETSGFTEHLAEVMLDLSHHMEPVIRALSIFTTGVVVYTTAAAIAYSATIHWMAALTSFAGIAAIVAMGVAALLTFGDQIKLNASGTVTVLSAVTGIIKALVSAIQTLGKSAIELVQYLMSANGELSALTQVLGGVTLTVLGLVAVNVAAWIYGIVAALVAMTATFIRVGAVVVAFAGLLVGVAYAWIRFRAGAEAANMMLHDLGETVKHVGEKAFGPLLEKMEQHGHASHNIAQTTNLMGTSFNSAAGAVNAHAGAMNNAATATRGYGLAAAQANMSHEALITHFKEIAATKPDAVFQQITNTVNAAGEAIKTTTGYTRDLNGALSASTNEVTKTGENFTKTTRFTNDLDGQMRILSETETKLSGTTRTTTETFMQLDGTMKTVTTSVENGVVRAMKAADNAMSQTTSRAQTATSAMQSLAAESTKAAAIFNATTNKSQEELNWDAEVWGASSSSMIRSGAGVGIPRSGMSAPAYSTIHAGGFAEGGSFMVSGSGGTDSQSVRFLATPGERVTVETPPQSARRFSGSFGGLAGPNPIIARQPASSGSTGSAAPGSTITLGNNTTVHMTVLATDAASFRRTQGQLAAQLADKIHRAQAQIGRR